MFVDTINDHIINPMFFCYVVHELDGVQVIGTEYFVMADDGGLNGGLWGSTIF